MNHSGVPSTDQQNSSGGSLRGCRVLGLMAKYWTPGQVKTRLGRSIGMQRSARLHQLFVQHLCQTLGDVGSIREFVAAPDDALATLATQLTSPWTLVAQSDGDLGERMKTWFRRHLTGAPAADTEAVSNATNRPAYSRGPLAHESGDKRIVLIGADCPTLSPGELERSFDTLVDHDVVLGPAADGGYYLVGINSRCADAATVMFDVMTWSNSDVLATTRDRLRLAEISFTELPIREDVDTIVELHSLRDDLIAGPDLQPLLESIDQILVSEDLS